MGVHGRGEEPWGALGRPGEAGGALASPGRPGEPWRAWGALRSRALPAVAGRWNTTPSANPSPAKLWVNLGASAALNPKR